LVEEKRAYYAALLDMKKVEHEKKIEVLELKKLYYTRRVIEE